MGTVVDLNYAVTEGYRQRVISANGTYNCVRAGNRVKIHKIFYYNPSEAGGTITIKDGNGTTIIPNIDATKHGQHELNLWEVQTTDYGNYIGIDGLQVVVADCTGTFVFGISWV